jgi:hypothetical protein
MKIEKRTNTDVKIEGVADLFLENPSMTMEEAIKNIKSLGNQIIEVDEKQKRIRILDTNLYLEEEVWVCDYCKAYSRSREKIEKHEAICLEKSIPDINSLEVKTS